MHRLSDESKRYGQPVDSDFRQFIFPLNIKFPNVITSNDHKRINFEFLEDSINLSKSGDTRLMKSEELDEELSLFRPNRAEIQYSVDRQDEAFAEMRARDEQERTFAALPHKTQPTIAELYGRSDVRAWDNFPRPDTRPLSAASPESSSSNVDVSEEPCPPLSSSSQSSNSTDASSSDDFDHDPEMDIISRGIEKTHVEIEQVQVHDEGYASNDWHHFALEHSTRYLGQSSPQAQTLPNFFPDFQDELPIPDTHILPAANNLVYSPPPEVLALPETATVGSVFTLGSAPSPSFSPAPTLVKKRTKPAAQNSVEANNVPPPKMAKKLSPLEVKWSQVAPDDPQYLPYQIMLQSRTEYGVDKKGKQIEVYVCTQDNCNQQFSRRGDLERHVLKSKVHLTVFAIVQQCPRCNKVHTRKDALARHIAQNACHKRKTKNPIQYAAVASQDAGADNNLFISPTTIER